MSVSFLDLALKIATEAHRGQIDKAGKDYIEHPKKVASFCTTDEEKAVAYLHDVIEDTDYGLSDLQKQGMPNDVLVAVDALTKKKGQSYQEYLDKVKSNGLARIVKLADLRHNSDLSRLPEVTDKDIERFKKYQNAITFLST